MTLTNEKSPAVSPEGGTAVSVCANCKEPIPYGFGRPRKFCDNARRCENQYAKKARRARYLEAEERRNDPENIRAERIARGQKWVDHYDDPALVIDDALAENIRAMKADLAWWREAPIEFWRHRIGCSGNDPECTWDACNHWAKAEADGASGAPADGGFQRSEVLAMAQTIAENQGRPWPETYWDLGWDAKHEAVSRLAETV